MHAIEEQTKLNAEWLKLLSRRKAKEAKRGLVAGRRWGENGRSYTAVAAVVAFVAVVTGEVYEAIGEDEDFDEALNEEVPFQMGWFLGVGEAYAGMIETAA